MMTLYDYLPSQNGYKLRLLLSHPKRPYATESCGAVPVLELEDGRVLTESKRLGLAPLREHDRQACRARS